MAEMNLIRTRNILEVEIKGSASTSLKQQTGGGERSMGENLVPRHDETLSCAEKEETGAALCSSHNLLPSADSASDRLPTTWV